MKNTFGSKRIEGVPSLTIFSSTLKRNACTIIIRTDGDFIENYLISKIKYYISIFEMAVRQYYNLLQLNSEYKITGIV